MVVEFIDSQGVELDKWEKVTDTPAVGDRVKLNQPEPWWRVHNRYWTNRDGQVVVLCYVGVEPKDPLLTVKKEG